MVRDDLDALLQVSKRLMAMALSPATLLRSHQPTAV